ncbi:MAG: hypothetical protein JWO43_580 [Candidatus Adlerbacteria bacterium]|nr:hypothetical protein [Candidatus Adlerbacteria bacterium]
MSKKEITLILVGVVAVFCALFGVVYAASNSRMFVLTYNSAVVGTKDVGTKIVQAVIPPPTLDKKAYDAKMMQLANLPVPKVASTTATSTATTTPKLTGPWPVKAAYPNVGAILPFNRIIAYYGNFYSKGMGVLGQYPEEEMLAKLRAEVKNWEEADPTTPVVPAIDYIVITAQGSPGKDGKYRLRMPDSQVDIALELAKKVNGIVILEVQVGLSDLQTEVPIYESYLKMPNVHLALDPEFAMQTSGVKPGRVIGTLDAKDINWAANYLAKLVQENNLPPKILLIHRFTEDMVTNYKQITPLPEVQMVMDMDGWGFGAKKINTYERVVVEEPVQFTGFKLFYKNDLLAPSTRMLTPAELLELSPQPSFIQYQ